MDMTFTDQNLGLAIALEVERKDSEKVHAPAYPDNYVVFDSGVVLEVTGITPDMYQDIAELHESTRPTVPVLHIPSKGRTEENPNDPEYVEKVKRWQNKLNYAVLHVIYILGSRVVVIPEGMPAPDSETWREEYMNTGLMKTGSKGELRAAWIKAYAVSKNQERARDERTKVFNVVARILGVSEKDVTEAAKRP